MGTKRNELEAAAQDCPEIAESLRHAEQGLLDYESALEDALLKLKAENDSLASELGALTECEHEWEEMSEGVMGCTNIECLETRPKTTEDR